MLKSAKKVYQEIVNDDEGRLRHAIMIPRNYRHVINILFIYMHSTLHLFIKIITLHPRIFVHLFSSPLLESLCYLVKESSDVVKREVVTIQGPTPSTHTGSISLIGYGHNPGSCKGASSSSSDYSYL